MKQKLKSFIGKIMSFFVRFFPVSKKIWAFNSFPDFTDNPYGFYFKAVAKRPDVHFVWLISDCSLVSKIRGQIKYGNVSVYYKRSLMGLWYFLRAGYLFVSHGIFERYSAEKSKKIVVNLWHGMPLKRICYMESQTEWVTYTDYVVATSPLFQDIMGKSFRKDKEHTLLVGQPRNDLFFEKTDFFEKRGIDRGAYKKVGIWLPTYRYSLIQQRTDGAFHEGQLLFLTIDDMKELNDFLVRENVLVVVKLHPMDYLQKADLPVFSNLLIVKQKEFDSQLYPLLGNCDFLFTDYSSVWLDYEILNKPIGFVCDDFEEYEKGRGFTVPDLVKMLPGPVLKNLQEVEDFIVNMPSELGESSSVFNQFKDGLSSERLLSLLPSLSK